MRRASPVTAVCLLLGLIAAAQAQTAPGPAEPAWAPPPTLAPYADALQPLPSSITGIQGRTYIPVHSSLMALGGSTRIDFAITLSVHNPSAGRAVILERIEYHDTAGRVVDTPLDRPVALRPFGTIQIVIPQPDTRAGLGADFVVDWTAPTASIEPIVEAVMLSQHGSQGYSFSTVGRKVER